jgi:membrane protein DedA with SNARE-associated domain
MGLESYFEQMTAFAREHQAWAVPIMFALAFAESLAFVSLVIPAWGALVAIGVALGDWLSYWIGRKLEHRVANIWPLSRNPGLIPRGEAFVKKWGILGIFIGRFSGPLRASVPLVAGIFEMPYWRFQFANFASAFVWAGVLLLFGDGLSKTLTLFAK